jgi:hypothetical protein
MDRLKAWLISESTLSKPFGFEKVLGLSVVGVLGGSAAAAFKTCGGTAALPKVVISASLAVLRRKRPAT